MFLPTMILAQSLRVIYPNGGERFRADSTVTIRWESSGITDEIEVEYSTDGSQWRGIRRVESNVTSLAWTVPGRISNSARVRVITKREDYSDASDGTFEIVANPLNIPLVIAPNGGEVWTEGETQTIRWQLPADAADALVELSTNGATWTTIGTVAAAPASMQWTIPHLSDNIIPSALIRVSVVGDAAEFDISDAPFTIRPRATTPISSLRLLAPNGGERYQVDSTLWIRWSSENLSGEIGVEYSIDGGTRWNTIGTRDVAAGSIDWKVPNDPTTTALVRIATKDGTVNDRSDAPFTIAKRDSANGGGGEVATKLLAPNGGESWMEGEEHAIAWQMPAAAASALIEISIDGGMVWSPITVVAAGSGSYMWRVPRFANAPIASAMIRVSDLAAATRIDASDAAFTLLPRPSVSSVDERLSYESGAVARIYPNPASDRFEIRWRQNGSADVTARLVASDGSIVRQLDAGTRSGGEQSLQIDLDRLAAGTYMYELHAGAVMRGLVIVVR
jgi:hypothetical protein